MVKGMNSLTSVGGATPNLGPIAIFRRILQHFLLCFLKRFLPFIMPPFNMETSQKGKIADCG